MPLLQRERLFVRRREQSVDYNTLLIEGEHAHRFKINREKWARNTDSFGPHFAQSIKDLPDGLKESPVR